MLAPHYIICHPSFSTDISINKYGARIMYLAHMPDFFQKEMEQRAWLVSVNGIKSKWCPRAFLFYISNSHYWI